MLLDSFCLFHVKHLTDVIYITVKHFELHFLYERSYTNKVFIIMIIKRLSPMRFLPAWLPVTIGDATII